MDEDDNDDEDDDDDDGVGDEDGQEEENDHENTHESLDSMLTMRHITMLALLERVAIWTSRENASQAREHSTVPLMPPLATEHSLVGRNHSLKALLKEISSREEPQSYYPNMSWHPFIHSISFYHCIITNTYTHWSTETQQHTCKSRQTKHFASRKVLGKS